MTLVTFVSLNENESKYAHLKRERERTFPLFCEMFLEQSQGWRQMLTLLLLKSNIFHGDAYTLIERVTKKILTHIWRSKLVKLPNW